MSPLRPQLHPLDAALAVLSWLRYVGILLLAAAGWWACSELVNGPVLGTDHAIRRALCSLFMGSVSALFCAVVDDARSRR